jgi:hypothetical protein
MLNVTRIIHEARGLSDAQAAEVLALIRRFKAENPASSEQLRREALANLKTYQGRGKPVTPFSRDDIHER